MGKLHKPREIPTPCDSRPTWVYTSQIMSSMKSAGSTMEKMAATAVCAEEPDVRNSAQQKSEKLSAKGSSLKSL